VFAGFIVGTLVGPKRHTYFYADEARQQLILQVIQLKKLEWLYKTFTIQSGDGQDLAHFKKHVIFDIFRKRWEVTRPDGQKWFLAQEDSVIKAVLRRLFGPAAGLLRTNFIFNHPDKEEWVYGKFDRKFHILDRYFLDMTPDSEDYIDRRVALGIGIMLDTGERR
jgi:uncharacterized protein YxjI